MASEPTPEQSELRRKGRQRLVGAVVLALLAVVFVPMILDPAPRESRNEPVLAIPAKEGAPALALAPAPATVPAAAPADAPAARPAADGAAKPAEPAKAPEAGPATKAPEAAPATKAPEAAPAAKAPAKAPEPKAPAPRPAAKGAEAKPAPLPKLEGFAVQVGAFKEEAKLTHARDKLKGIRVAHYTERLATASGELTRLRAGPFPTREAAEKAAADMKKAGLDGRVVPLP